MAHDPAYGLNDKQAAALREFLSVRSEAIAYFGSFEQALAQLFGVLTGMGEQETGIVFFRINNVRSIVDMMKKLKQLRFENQYSSFFNSTLSGIKRLAEERNSVVHWAPRLNVTQIADTEESDVSFELAKPNFWEATYGMPTKTITDLEDFIRRSAFMKSAVWTLSWAWQQNGKIPEASLEILSEGFSYPPPDAHPLSWNFPDNENLPSA